MGRALPELILRKHTRFKRLIPVRYMNEGPTGSGIMTDLSMNGTKITGDTVVTVGTVFTVQMFIPGHVAPSWIEKVKVQWVKGSEFGVTFEMHDSEGVEQMTLSRVIRGLH